MLRSDNCIVPRCDGFKVSGKQIAHPKSDGDSGRHPLTEINGARFLLALVTHKEGCASRSDDEFREFRVFFSRSKCFS